MKWCAESADTRQHRSYSTTAGREDYQEETGDNHSQVAECEGAGQKEEDSARQESLLKGSQIAPNGDDRSHRGWGSSRLGLIAERVRYDRREAMTEKRERNVLELFCVRDY